VSRRREAFEERVAAAVIRKLEERGIVPPVQGFSSRSGEEASCRDDATKNAGSSGHTTTAEKSDTSSSTPEHVKKKISDALTRLRAKPRRKAS
jgi:hypothetical protein